MKRFVITLLAVFYLGVSSGATVHFHYCMGQLIDWGLSQEKAESDKTCSNCGMIKGNADDCCKDKQQEYKVKDFQKSASSFFQVKVFALEPLAFNQLTETAVSSASLPHPVGNAPPRSEKTPVFLRHCNFRI